MAGKEKHVEILQQRHELRKQMKQKRQALSSSQLQEYTLSLQYYVHQYLLNAPSIQTLMTYFPIQQEANPLSRAMMQNWRNSHKTLLLPRVESLDPPTLSSVPFVGEDEHQGNMSSWGIFEPNGSIVNPQKIDCVLVPGLAFDKAGYRLGYGKGFYDRFLPRLRPDAITIGIGYSFQVVESTWPQPYDVRLQVMITEQGVRWFPST